MGDTDRGPILYGEFPRLFYGLPPEEAVDLTDFETMLCIIRNAPEEVKERLVDRVLLKQHADKLKALDESWALFHRLEERDELPELTASPSPADATPTDAPPTEASAGRAPPRGDAP